MLLILDGWGIGNHDFSDAIYAAKTPFMDHLMASEATCRLKTFGPNVGLPEGQMGNSEVGHMNIGAGRIVYQMLVRINQSFQDGSVAKLPRMEQLLEEVRSGSGLMHLIGLVSDGGVHSSIDHLIGLLEVFRNEGLDHKVRIHCFMDGRDTDPKSGQTYLQKLMQPEILGKARIASVVGRYYAMDRDRRWERIKKAYDLMVHGTGARYADPLQGLSDSYAAGVTDEFIEPIVLTDVHSEPLGQIREGDSVLCFNFRTDRGREITEVLTQQAFHEYNMHPLRINYVTMTEYDKSFQNVSILFGNQDLRMTLGEHIAQLGLRQVRAAETEKYPHVTFFFSGGREDAFDGEERVLIPSPKVATYDLQPEMSAPELKKAVLDVLDDGRTDFLCVNFANPDMVGHTGVFDAIVKACETVDGCVKDLVETGRKNEYNIVIIADHGNADLAINPDGSPNTAHSLNLVPCVVLSNRKLKLHDGILADVAPTILELMELNKPAEMTGQSLIQPS